MNEVAVNQSKQSAKKGPPMVQLRGVSSIVIDGCGGGLWHVLLLWRRNAAAGKSMQACMWSQRRARSGRILCACLVGCCFVMSIIYVKACPHQDVCV